MKLTPEQVASTRLEKHVAHLDKQIATLEKKVWNLEAAKQERRSDWEWEWEWEYSE